MLETPDITVLIKAPNQKYEDHPVHCRGNWTVEQLKGHLAENYPTKPTLREQRLIYSGQLLTDDSRLGDVLRRHDDDSTVHTVHLVCAPPAEPPATAPATATGLRQRRQQQQQQQQPQQPQQQPQQPQHQVAADAAPAPAPVAAPLPQHYDLMQWAHQLHNNQHQLLAMQQMYSQYWAQYAQMLQGNPAALPFIWPQPTPAPTVGSSSGSPAAGPAAPAAPDAPAPAPAAAPAEAGQPQPPPAVNQNIRLNAQGGVMADEEDEAGGQWDWLDWLHGLARLTVLFLAVYFYASVSRLVVVLGFGFLAYLYNQGWFQAARPAPVVAREPEPPAPPREDAAPAPDDEHQRPEDDEDRPEDGRLRVSEELQRVMEQMGVEAPALEARPHPFTLAWTFFTSFFASLVPDRLDQ